MTDAPLMRTHDGLQLHVMPEGPEDALGAKRTKGAAALSVGQDDEVVFIDDSAGGAIVIDDD